MNATQWTGPGRGSTVQELTDAWKSSAHTPPTHTEKEALEHLSDLVDRLTDPDTRTNLAWRGCTLTEYDFRRILNAEIPT